MDDRQNRIKEYAFLFKNALIRLGPIYQHGKDGKKYQVRSMIAKYSLRWW